jgi:hypothetical protein
MVTIRRKANVLLQPKAATIESRLQGGPMPPWLIELASKHWGFAAPLFYASVAYGCFHWLDKKASGAAKRALTERLRSTMFSKEILANFTLDVFDKIYSTPLLHPKALIRSAIVTSIVSFILWYELDVLEKFSIDVTGFWRMLVFFVGFAVLTDYISLFFVRHWLVSVGSRPIFGLIVAAVVGIIIVYLGHLLRSLFFGLLPFDTPAYEDFDGWHYFFGTMNLFDPMNNTLAKGTLPAFAVHLWFPIFAVAVLATQGLTVVFKALGWMQWFLKQGQHHPFQAVGYVAALIVFAVAVLLELVVRLR